MRCRLSRLGGVRRSQSSRRRSPSPVTCAAERYRIAPPSYATRVAISPRMGSARRTAISATSSTATGAANTGATSERKVARRSASSDWLRACASSRATMVWLMASANS